MDKTYFGKRHLKKPAVPLSSYIPGSKTHLWLGIGACLLCLPLLPMAAYGEEVPITLLHLNDVYLIEANPKTPLGLGGLARVATLAKAIQKENPNTVFVFGGDTLAPSLASQFYQGKQMVAAWNLLGVQAAVLGNHEFDFGPEVLQQRIAQSKFPWLGANVIDIHTGKRLQNIQPFVMLPISPSRNPHSNPLNSRLNTANKPLVWLAIAGVITAETATSSRPGPGIRFEDPVQTMAKAVKTLRDKDGKRPDITVFLTHLTMKQDQALAQKHQPALILGGHDHEVLQSVVGKTPIYKVGSDAPYLGKFTLVWDTTKRKVVRIDSELIPVTPDIPEDAAFLTATRPFEAELTQKLSVPVITLTKPLNLRQDQVRTRPMPVGMLIGEAYRQWGDTDIGLVNSGSIRGDQVFQPGTLTVRDIYTMLPFGNELVRLELTGAQLKEVVRHSLSQYPQTGTGRYLQRSGMSIGFTQDNAGKITLLELKVNNQPLDNERTYTVTTSSYLADGGDGYTMLPQAKRLPLPKGAITEAVCLQQFLTQIAKQQQDGKESQPPWEFAP